MSNQPTWPGLGSVSCATMREDDLIPSFLGVLEQYAPDTARRLQWQNRKLLNRMGLTEKEHLSCDWQKDADLCEWASYFLNEELWSAMDSLAPAYVCFSAHEGDGADYGYWVVWESLEEDVENGTILRIPDEDDMPNTDVIRDGSFAYILVSDDRYNFAKFYAVSGDRETLSEVWEY